LKLVEENMRRRTDFPDHSRAQLLVAAQFGLIILLLFSTRFRLHGWAMVCIATAVLLLLWGVASMRRSRLRVTPIPAKDASLVTSGPYRFIRHPMYTSVLLGSVGLLVMDFGLLRLALLMLLILVLSLKLRFEEALLSRLFPDYPEYMRRTRMLIPFIY
jgi:protein-S-isoprenylcysteine O-methyltransferase Ste14